MQVYRCGGGGGCLEVQSQNTSRQEQGTYRWVEAVQVVEKVW